MVLPLSLGLPPPRPHRWLEARRLCAPTVKRGARLPLWVDAVEKGDFAMNGKQHRFKIKCKCAILIQKSARRDSIVSNSNSTVRLRTLFRQHGSFASTAIATRRGGRSHLFRLLQVQLSHRLFVARH